MAVLLGVFFGSDWFGFAGGIIGGLLGGCLGAAMLRPWIPPNRVPATGCYQDQVADLHQGLVDNRRP